MSPCAALVSLVCAWGLAAHGRSVVAAPAAPATANGFALALGGAGELSTLSEFQWPCADWSVMFWARFPKLMSNAHFLQLVGSAEEFAAPPTCPSYAQAGMVTLPPSSVTLALFQYDTLVLGVGLQRIQLGRSLAATQSWQHVALTYSATNSTVMLYVNGSLVANVSAAIAPCSIGYGRMFLGRQRWGETTEAVFDDVRLFNSSVSASDVVRVLYGGTLPPALLLQWDFDDVHTFFRDGVVSDASPSGGLDGMAFSVQVTATMTAYLPITLIASTQPGNRSADVTLIPSDAPALSPRVHTGHDSTLSGRVVYAAVLDTGGNATLQLAGVSALSPWAGGGIMGPYSVLRMNATAPSLAGATQLQLVTDALTGTVRIPFNSTRVAGAAAFVVPFEEVQLTLDAVLSSTSSPLNYAPARIQSAVAAVLINSGPVAANLTFETDWNTPLAVDVSSGAFPDNTFLPDLEGDAVSATILSLPARGTLYSSVGRHALVPAGTPLQVGDTIASGVVLFVPPVFAFGLQFANFTYMLTDSRGASSAPASVVINVNQGAFVPSPGVCDAAARNRTLNNAECAYVCAASSVSVSENGFSLLQLSAQTYVSADAAMLRITQAPMYGALYQVLDPSIPWHHSLMPPPPPNAPYNIAMPPPTQFPYLLRRLGARMSPGAIQSEWVASVLGFSSQWDNVTWSAQNLVGPANVLSPTTGYTTTWSTSGQNEHEFVIVGFATPLFLVSVHIFEVWYPGNIVALTAMGPAGEIMVLWEGDRTYPAAGGGPRIFSPPTCSPHFPVNALRLDLYIPTADLYAGVLPELDAVLLRGQPYPASDRLVAGSNTIMFVPPAYVYGQDMFAYQATDCAYSRDSLDMQLPCSIIETDTTHALTAPVITSVWQLRDPVVASMVASGNDTVAAAVASNASLARMLSSRSAVPDIADTPDTPAWLGPLRGWGEVQHIVGSGSGTTGATASSISSTACTAASDTACTVRILAQYSNLDALFVDYDDVVVPLNVTLWVTTSRNRGTVSVQVLESATTASQFAIISVRPRPGDCGSNFDALVVRASTNASTGSPVTIPWMVACTPGSQQLPVAVMTAIRVLGPMAMLWTLALGGTFWWYSKHRVLAAAQPYVVLLHPLGGFLVILLLPILSEMQPSIAQCVSLRFVGSLAFTLFFGVLFAKSYRVFKLLLKIHINPMLKRVSFPPWRMFMLMGSYLVVELLIDILWTISAPISIVSVADPDPSITVLRCKGGYDRWFLYLWVFLKLGIMAAATYLGVMTFTVDSHHGESRVVNAGIFVSSTATLVLLMLYILFQDSDPRVAVSLGAIGAVFVVCITEGIVLLPRIMQARHMAAAADDEESTATAVRSVHSIDAQLARERGGGSITRYGSAAVITARRTSASGADVAVALELPERGGVHRMSQSSIAHAQPPHAQQEQAPRPWGSAGTAYGYYDAPAVVPALAAAVASEADAGILEDDETHMPFAALFHRNADERLPAVAEDTNDSSSRAPSVLPASADLHINAPLPVMSARGRGVLLATADGDSDAQPQHTAMQQTSSIFDSSLEVTSHGAASNSAVPVPASALASAEDSTLYDYATGAPPRGEVNMNMYE